MSNYQRYQYSVLDIAADLRSGVIGTGDMPREHAEFANHLRMHLADWQPSASPYDAAVLLLCSEALREYEAWAGVKESDTWL